MRIAPPKARLLAGLLDRLVVVLGMVAVLGAGMSAAAVYERVRGTPAEGAEDDDVEGSFELSRLQTVALWLAASGVTVRLRNRRSLGSRVLGLRRVDARSGGLVSIRGALVGAMFESAWGAAIQCFHRGDTERTRQRVRALSARVKEIERRHPDDPRARRDAVAELYANDTPRPFQGCVARLLTTTMWQLLPSIPIGGRCIRDWVTGTVVVVDR